MGSFVRDLRQGVRQLVRAPAFAAAAIASLALGIGLNTTLFSIVNAVLLREGPAGRPDRLVEIYTGLNEDFPQLTTSYPDYLDIRRDADALSGLAASAYVRGIFSSGERPALVTGETVSSDYFDVLGIRPALGRAFRDDENAAPGAAPVVVLSHGLWQRRLGGRPDVVGSTIELSGLVYTVVGVAPAGFTGTLPGLPTEFWTPLMMVDRLQFAGLQTAADNDPGATRLERRGTRWLFLKGRLAEGRTIAEARAQVDTIFARLRSDFPATNETTTASVLPASSIRFHPLLDGYVRSASAALLAAVGLVLLIACANVANLLLARGAARRRELAVRAALGASRARIVGQLLTEAAVLAAAGGALGVLLAWWAGRALAGVGLDLLPVPVSFDFSIDVRVLAFALGASIVTALLFGVAPAVSASRHDLVPDLKAPPEPGSRRLTAGQALVVVQLALSLVLLVAGALLARGLLAARGTDLGYDARAVSSLAFNLQMNGYDLDRATALRERALQALRALPGVAAVSTASRVPLAPDIRVESVLVQGLHAPGDDGTTVDVADVGADYFSVLGVPLIAGRAFSEADVAEQRPVAVVNETLARQFWGDRAAIGQQLYLGTYTSTPYEIVGVARDHKVRSVGESPRPYLHLPDAPSRRIGLVVRTAMPAAAALPMLRQALWALEPDILFTDEASAEAVAAATVAPTRLGAVVLGIFGALALLMAAVGLYGVVAYSVSRRTREVGIRVALGAERRQVLQLILGQGLRLTLAGLVVGAAAAAVAARVLGSLLYGVSGFDPLAYGAAAGVLMVASIAANLIPALAAARVDPVRALKNE